MIIHHYCYIYIYVQTTKTNDNSKKNNKLDSYKL